MVEMNEPKKSEELGVTVRLLQLTKDELKRDITSLQLETKAIEHRLKNEIVAAKTDLRTEMAQLKTELSGLKGEFVELKSDVVTIKNDIVILRTDMQKGFNDLSNQMTKMLAIVEEQNQRNKFALDGYAFVYESMQNSNGRLDRLEFKVFGSS